MTFDNFGEYLANQCSHRAARMNFSSASFVKTKCSGYSLSYKLVCLGFEPTPMFSYKTAILFV